MATHRSSVVSVLVGFALTIVLSMGAAASNLTSLTLKPTSVVMGTPAEGTVTLDGPAGPGGVNVTLATENPGVVTVPGSVLVPQGATSARFRADTLAVSSSTPVDIQATLDIVMKTATLTVTPRVPVRGVAGDLWADIIIGQPDFGQYASGQVTSARLANLEGVLVDRSVRPNRVYTYDGSNSRVLGSSHLGACLAGVKGGQWCTTNSDCPGSTCAIQEGIGADLVLGQPSFNSSGCNGDSNFQHYPNRAPASASTLCSEPESQISILEGGSIANLAVDGAGNLYVPDWDNARVLRYNSPFTTDTIADYVWGQLDFTGNGCNRGRGVGFPDRQSLCFRSPYNEGFTGGVAIDGSGNLWVTDNQNNRVLRFPFDTKSGVAGQVADLVLGQPNFTSWQHGSELNQMWAPQAVRVDTTGTVYVVDSQPGGGGDLSGRVLIFRPPLSSGMSATSVIGAGMLRNPTGLELDPATGGFWVSDSSNNQLLLFVSGVVQKVLFKDLPDSSGACGGNYQGDGPQFYSQGDNQYVDSFNVCGSFGGIGIDNDGNLFVGAWHDVWRFPAPLPLPQQGIAHSADKRIFEPYQFDIFNYIGPSGLSNINGLAVAGGQLIVADYGRILFWNNTGSLTNGQSADGYVGVSSFLIEGQQRYGRATTDKAGHLWVIKNPDGVNGLIEAYSLPLTTGATPSLVLTSPLPVLGGGEVSWDFLLVIGAVAVNQSGSRLWVADPLRNRVFRVENPLTNPVVDVVLGQTDLNGTLCNQGNGDEGHLIPSRTSLCKPGSVVLDPQGDVYVSDDSLEVSGNQRLLEYDAGLFPDNPSTALFGIPASRVFGRNGSFTEPACQDQLCGPLQPAFSSDGQMVVGLNGYIGSRFPLVYKTPLGSQQVDTYLNDFSSFGGYAATFDSNNDLYIADLDRQRVLVYRQPLPSGPRVTMAPPSLDFGLQGAHRMNKPQIVVLINSGTAPLSITSIAINGQNSGDFSQDNNCPLNSNTLAPGDNCKIRVIFSPTGGGTRTAAVTITDNAPDSPQMVPVTGIGVGGKVSLK